MASRGQRHAKNSFLGGFGDFRVFPRVEISWDPLTYVRKHILNLGTKPIDSRPIVVGFRVGRNGYGGVAKVIVWVRGCGPAYRLGAGVWPSLSSGCGVIRGHFEAFSGVGFQKRKYILNCGSQPIDSRAI